jgi:hypothetical protein
MTVMARPGTVCCPITIANLSVLALLLFEFVVQSYVRVSLDIEGEADEYIPNNRTNNPD